jgi:chromate transporter
MTAAPRPSFREALRLWTYVGCNSFGGPAGQIAVMHRVLVEEKRWICEERFLHALNYCMLLPGPEATQLAVYVGWLLHGAIGGLAAGILFVVPGCLAMFALSAVYAAFGRLPFVQAIFAGIQPAVLAIVVEAVHRIGKRALASRARVAIAAGAFLALYLFAVPFPIVILLAAAAGIAVRAAPAAERVDVEEIASTRGQRTLARSLRVLAFGLLVWFGPLLLLARVFGGESVFVREGLFFSRAAVVTFGGAYAVLSYVAQQAVDVYGWLHPGQMMDGLGLAETTPGPLILVTQFVGFQGAHGRPGALDPMLAGFLGGAVTLWVTFVPCFLWIFLGAPWIEATRGIRAISSALSGITAAVVGVILNLALWFAKHALFARVVDLRGGWIRATLPDLPSLRPASLLIAALAMVAMLRFKVGMIPTIAASAVLGVLLAR